MLASFASRSAVAFMPRSGTSSALVGAPRRLVRSSFVRPLSQSSSTTTAIPEVLPMMPAKFYEILTEPATRAQYQIVDVRGKDEMRIASIRGNDVVHLPIANVDSWLSKVQSGELLDAKKPTICLCHHGIRSQRMASFLLSHCHFSEVYSLVGGIQQYAAEMDPSVGFY